MTDKEIREAAWANLLDGAESAAEDWIDEAGDYPDLDKRTMRRVQLDMISALRDQAPPHVVVS